MDSVLLARSSIVFHMFVIFKLLSERMIMSEVSKIMQLLLHSIFLRVEEFPRSPLAHESEQFNFVVSCEDKLFSKSMSDLFLNLANVLSLINDLHAEAGQFTRKELITIFVG